MNLPAFLRHTLLLFVALRAADFVNVAAGLWIVPRFVRPEDLGAVLPVVTFATTLATPAFAFAFVLMRASNRLAADRAFGQLKSLLVGAFLGTAVLLLGLLAVSAAFLPGFAADMHAGSPRVAFLALAAAFLGSFAPVYSDALNGLKRFAAYGLTEIAAAVARVVTMLALMPVHALAGFFCGNTAQPLMRICGAVFALRHELGVPAEPYWTKNVCRHHVKSYAGVLAYLLPPLIASLVELSLVRTLLSPETSAHYYLATRLTDLLGYLTLPILLVLFPAAAETARAGRSTRPLVRNTMLCALIGALLLAAVYVPFGRDLIRLLPNGAASADDPALTRHLLLLLAITATGAAQTFYTNTEIAAGRFRFLAWFVPLHAVYALWLATATFLPSLDTLLSVFLAFGLIRLAGCLSANAVSPTPRTAPPPPPTAARAYANT